MDGDDNRSSEATESYGGDEIRDGEKDEQNKVSRNRSSDCGTDENSREKSKVRQLETLTSVQLSESDAQADFNESSHLLSEVPVEFSLQPIIEDQVTETHEKTLKAAIDGPSASVAQPICSIPSPTILEQKLGPIESRNKQDKQNSSGPKPLSSVPMPKAPSDGYNWRKYGQKQVKSPEGSRSYYRCTFSDCHAKKIECSDRFHRATETVYRSQHNHDPPQKVNCTRENRHALQIVPVNGSDDITHPERSVNDQVPSTPSKEPLLAIDQIHETTQQESSGSDETTEIDVKEEYEDGPESRKRQKRNSTGEVGPLPKTGKTPKFVVHEADDVGISGDGYRWRKYGQKMVKGNPHPRNYYRCTSAGCPVRKHIEKAVDNSTTVVITYKGVHDHDTPVPRKRNKTEQHKSQTQLTGQALTTGGEKTAESTRTLLSVGFEIKPC